MQIILFDKNLTKTHSLTVRKRHYISAIAIFSSLVLVFAIIISFLLISLAGSGYVPFASGLVTSLAQEESARQSRQSQEDMNQMAIKIGEMQAQLMRLDALGERLQGLSGISPEEFKFKEKPGQGGLAPTNYEKTEISDIKEAIGKLEDRIRQRLDYLSFVEMSLVSRQMKSKMLPTSQPVSVGYISSDFGTRFDPFTGHTTTHKGIDFAAPVGTRVSAAAGGVVILAEFSPSYGNQIDIDHGNGLVTRYAHNSKLLVKAGDIVKRGQDIAEVGSTGCSTGPHLHFEVLVNGVQQDPQKFLAADEKQNNLQAILSAE